jgi:hypothetical protein
MTPVNILSGENSEAYVDRHKIRAGMSATTPVQLSERQALAESKYLGLRAGFCPKCECPYCFHTIVDLDGNSFILEQCFGPGCVRFGTFSDYRNTLPGTCDTKVIFNVTSIEYYPKEKVGAGGPTARRSRSGPIKTSGPMPGKSSRQGQPLSSPTSKLQGRAPV